MKLFRIIPVLVCSVFLSFSAKSQDFPANEIDSVQFKIYDYLQNHDKIDYDSVEAEMIVVVVQTNDKNEISSIHLLADDKNKGIVFEILSKMTILDFRGWHPVNFPNKNILIPVYNIGRHPKIKNSSAELGFWNMKWGGRGGEGAKIEKQDKGSILLTGFYYKPPYLISDGIKMGINQKNQ